MLTIITYNIFHGKHFSEIIQWLKNTPADIICLQEFPEEKLDELEDLEFMKQKSFAFSRGIQKKRKILGQLTMFDTSKLTLLSNKNIDLGIDSLEKYYKKTPNSRSALITVFQHKDIQLVISNVHLSAATLNSTRRKQIEQVLNQLDKTPTIILGDFNYSSLFGRSGLVTFMKIHDFQVAGDKMVTNIYKKTIPQQLDYVFLKNVLLKKIQVEKLPYSDHYPLITSIDV